MVCRFIAYCVLFLLDPVNFQSHLIQAKRAVEYGRVFDAKVTDRHTNDDCILNKLFSALVVTVRYLPRHIHWLVDSTYECILVVKSAPSMKHYNFSIVFGKPAISSDKKCDVTLWKVITAVKPSDRSQI
jgi:hypothetical protein